MNEQLIKIGLESGMLNYVDNETPRHYFLSGHADEQDLEKFAELIVRECLTQVDKVDAMLDDPKEKLGVSWVGLAIAKHFGVEE